MCLILGLVYLLIGAIAGAGLAWLMSDGLWPDAIGAEAAHPSTMEER